MKTKILVHGKSQSRTALGIINAYLKLHPDATPSEVQQAFPKSLNRCNVENLIVPVEKTTGYEKTFFEHQDEQIVFKNGARYSLVEIWAKDDFDAICEHAKQYGIEASQEGTKPFEKGSFTLEYLGEDNNMLGIRAAVPPPTDNLTMKQPATVKKPCGCKWWWWLLLLLLLLLLPLLIHLSIKCCYHDKGLNTDNAAIEKVTVAQPDNNSVKPETVTVAQPDNGSAKPETVAVAQPDNESAKPETVAVAQPDNESTKPETAAVVQPDNESAKPEPAAVAQPDNESAKPETAAVAQPDNESAKPETATNSLISDKGTLISITLPDGSVFDIAKDTPEFKLFSLLNSPDTQVETNGGWISLGQVCFDNGKAHLASSSENQLKNVARIMEFFPNSHLKVGGYTDNTGSDGLNMRLSAERAKVVANKLVSFGVTADRLAHEGYGSQYPVCPPNDTDACRAANRRVDMRITGK